MYQTNGLGFHRGIKRRISRRIRGVARGGIKFARGRGAIKQVKRSVRKVGKIGRKVVYVPIKIVNTSTGAAKRFVKVPVYAGYGKSGNVKIFKSVPRFKARNLSDKTVKVLNERLKKSPIPVKITPIKNPAKEAPLPIRRITAVVRTAPRESIRKDVVGGKEASKNDTLIKLGIGAVAILGGIMLFKT